MKKGFKLTTPYTPKGDQQQAIDTLVTGHGQHKLQTLLGITGSGKTFTMANVIAQVNKPTLVLAHNKTLAYQLYKEFKQFFPHNHVEYFISYFDYYQPESYLPQTDTYIEKDSLVNQEIERLRLRAAAALLSYNDVIIISSISCIYGMGSPQDWRAMSFVLNKGETCNRLDIARKLINLQYERNEVDLKPGTFRMKGNTIDVCLSFDQHIYRVILDEGIVLRISKHDPVTNNLISEQGELLVFPARQYVVPEERVAKAIESIKLELAEHVPTLGVLERERLTQRTKHDLEMIQEMGYCNGTENYSAHFEGRPFHTPPSCLLDFFPQDFLFFIDESHQTIPQAQAMYHGDRSRKKNLVEHGFRLPSAYSNRPLKFEELVCYFNNVVFVSATPGPYEEKQATNKAAQIIRPTGLLDPEITVRPATNQIDHLLGEIKQVIANNERILVGALTKRVAEDLTDYLVQAGIKAQYMHSDVDALQRIELIRQLRLGSFDVLVGINLLREGLDIPEVALVAILDADKLGFLRDTRSLIQTMGRAARNAHGRVILYADKETDAIREAIATTDARRKKQQAYNEAHGITPRTIVKPILEDDQSLQSLKKKSKKEINVLIKEFTKQMHKAAENLDFEQAILLRDKINKLKFQ